jgi:hypothetical protein
MIELGSTYRDKISGFVGVAIGYVTYITDCKQALLQPRGKDSTKRPEAEWIDETRLEKFGDARIDLHAEASPGFDKTPPSK